MTLPGDVPLPGLEGYVKAKRPRTAKEEDDATNRVRWNKFVSAKRVHCYVCIERRMNGQDIPVQRASWSRTQGSVEMLLCREHAQILRDYPQNEA